jgi:phage terminase small subunit
MPRSFIGSGLFCFMGKLNDKQHRFVDEYIIDLNATQAAIRAGYSPRTAEWQGPQLLGKPHVSEAIQKAIERRSRRTEINADYVLNRLVEIDQMDCLDILDDDGGLKPVRDWPKIWRQFISGFDVSEIFLGSGDERAVAGMLKKIKWPDKVKNLELIGRHVDVQAFADKTKMEHAGPGGGPMQTANVTYDQLAEAVNNVRTKF